MTTSLAPKTNRDLLENREYNIGSTLDHRTKVLVGIRLFVC